MTDPRNLAVNMGPSEANQAYFWTEEWQQAEAESTAEIAAGKGITFTNAEEAVLWLKRSDEPDAPAPGVPRG